MSQDYKVKYVCTDGSGEVRLRNNTISLGCKTDKYDVILEETVKQSSWKGDIVVYRIDELGTVPDVVKQCSSCVHSSDNNGTGTWCREPCDDEYSAFEEVN